MDDNSIAQYEPLPRWGHISATIGNKAYMWGGRTKDFSDAQKKKLASSVEVFDFKTETWFTRNTTGTPPAGIYNAAHAIHGSVLYVYGGWDGQKAHNALNKLNLETFTWSEVKCENPDNIPSEMSGCGLVAYGNKKLVLFGGYGAIKEKKQKKKRPTEQHELVTVDTECEVETREENGDTVEPTTLERATNGVDKQEAADTVNETEAVIENGVGEKGSVENDETQSSRLGGEEDKDRVKENVSEDEVRGKEDGRVGEGEKDVRKEEQITVKAEGEEADEMTDEVFRKSDVKTPQETHPSTNSVVSETKTSKTKKSVSIQLPVSFELSSTSEETAESSNDASLPKLECADVLPNEETNESEEDINMTYLIYKRNESDQKGWTNEVKVFDFDTGMWSSQPTSGCIPPPSVDFSFIGVDKKRAVVFGGYQPPSGITNDTFLLDMDTWVWTKLSGQSESLQSPSHSTHSVLLQPSARDGHSACVIQQQPRPLMLVTGGWGAMDNALSDMWLLDINSGLWSQITAEGEENRGRFWHTTVAYQFSSRMRQVLTFGGCPGAPESHTTGSWPKIANTVIVEMGKVPSLSNKFAGELSTDENWVVIGSVSQDTLGDPMQRLRETVLLTSFRVQRAEELLQKLAKRVEKFAVSVPKPTPKAQVQKALLQKVVAEEKEEEVKKVVKPFWQKSSDEVLMTYEEIGRGRYSVVKVAIYHETRVAAKCLFARPGSEENHKILMDCLEKAAQLRHPNLVSFMGAILEREPIIISELLPRSLRTVLEKSPLTYYQLVDVAEGVSKALEYLHSVKPDPVIHGDLTGTSVLIEGESGPRLKAKLCDYMTAKYIYHIMASSMTPSASIDDVFSTSKEHPSHEYKLLHGRRSRSQSPFEASNKSRNSPERPLRSGAQIKRKASSASSGLVDMSVFSTKRDVYLFGILLVEMATRTAVLEVSLQYLIESIAWPQVTALVKKCLTHEAELRPDMTSVLPLVIQLASIKP